MGKTPSAPLEVEFPRGRVKGRVRGIGEGDRGGARGREKRIDREGAEVRRGGRRRMKAGESEGGGRERGDE